MLSTGSYFRNFYLLYSVWNFITVKYFSTSQQRYRNKQHFLTLFLSLEFGVQQNEGRLVIKAFTKEKILSLIIFTMLLPNPGHGQTPSLSKVLIVGILIPTDLFWKWIEMFLQPLQWRVSLTQILPGFTATTCLFGWRNDLKPKHIRFTQEYS